MTKSQPPNVTDDDLAMPPLLAAAAAVLDELGLPSRYDPPTQQIVVSQASGLPNQPDWLLTLWVTAESAVHAFLPMTAAVPREEQAENIMWLSDNVPIPLNFSLVAFYAVPMELLDDGTAELGLYLRLPMPLDFSPNLFQAGLILWQQTIRAFEEIASQTEP